MKNLHKNRILAYQGLLLFLDYKISNLIAIVATKVLAYIVNKLFVFKSRCANFRELVSEMIKYVLSRGLTGVIDYVGVLAMVELLHVDEVISKYVLVVVVVVLNYIFGKYLVFQKKK